MRAKNPMSILNAKCYQILEWMSMCFDVNQFQRHKINNGEGVAD